MGRSRLSKVFSLRRADSWFHSMFWVIVALAATVPVSLVAVLAGADPAAVGFAAQLWSVAVLAGALLAAERSGNRRVVSSDRLVAWLVRRTEAHDRGGRR